MFALKIATFAKPKNVSRNPIGDRADMKLTDFEQTLRQLKRHDNTCN